MNVKYLPLCLGYSKSSINGSSYYYEFYLWNLGECESHRYSESPFLPLVSCPALAWGSSHMRKPFGPTKGARLLLLQPVPISFLTEEPRKAGVGEEGVWRSKSNHFPPGLPLTSLDDTLVLSLTWSRGSPAASEEPVGRARIYLRSHLTRWTRRLSVPFSRQKMAALCFLLTHWLPSACSFGSVPTGTSFPPRFVVSAFLGTRLIIRKLNQLHSHEKAGLGSLGSFYVACICSFCHWLCLGLVLNESNLEISTSHPNGKQRRVFCSCCGRSLNMEPHKYLGPVWGTRWHSWLRSYSWFRLEIWPQDGVSEPCVGLWAQWGVAWDGPSLRLFAPPLDVLTLCFSSK